MSNLTSVHDIVTYTKASKPFDGQRLATLTYKTDKKTGIKKESKCASVPRITDITSTDVMALKPYLVEWLELKQDAIIRERNDTGLKHVATEDISISSICEYLDSESKGSRFTKEYLIEWYIESLEENLLVLIMERLGFDANTMTPAQEAQVLKLGQNYRESFAALAGGATMYGEEKCKQLLRALEFASEGPTTSRLVERLTKMMVPKAEEGLLTL